MIETAIVQSCSVRSNYIEVWGIIFKVLSNSLISLVVASVASNISNSFEKCSPIISVTFTLFMFGVANCSLKFCGSVKYTQWQYTLHGVHAVSRTRSHSLTRCMAYSFVLWTMTELKHVLTRLITARHLEHIVLYVVRINILN